MVKKYFLKIIPLFLIIVTFFVIRYSIIYYNNARVLDASKYQNTNLSIKGYGLRLRTKDNKQVTDKNITLTNKENFTYILEIFNNTEEDHILELSLNINYIQSPFLVETSGSNEIMKKFNLNKGKKIDIPIVIDSNKFPFKINPLIFTIRNISKANSSFSFRYNIITDKTSNLRLTNDTIFNYKKVDRNDVKFDGVWLNNYFNKIDEYINTNSKINVKTNEYVKLALRTYSYTNDATFWMLVNGERVHFKDSTDYIYFHNVKDCLLYKELIFKAPDKKGTYEIFGFVASEPIDYINIDKLENYLIKTSNKVFINVY